MKPATSLLAGLVLRGGQAAAAAETSRGAQLAATCASCHEPGSSAKGIPAITGLDEQKIITAMLAYKVSQRPNHVMHAVALSLNDEELASVARYLAGQEKPGTLP